MNEIQTTEQTAVTISTEVTSPLVIMKQALESGVDLEKVSKMLELQEKWDAMEAKKAFTKAMAEFKANPPKILKDKTVGFESRRTGSSTSYSHATLANVTTQINSSLSKYGLSAAWTTNQIDNKISVTCIITHSMGHAESTSLTAGADTSGNKNSIQAIGSTITYLERYTMLALTGLATHDQDDDGNGYEEPEYVDEAKQSKIRDLLTVTNSDEGLFLKWLCCESIDKIDEVSYGRAIVNLQAKKDRNP